MRQQGGTERSEWTFRAGPHHTAGVTNTVYLLNTVALPWCPSVPPQTRSTVEQCPSKADAPHCVIVTLWHDISPSAKGMCFTVCAFERRQAEARMRVSHTPAVNRESNPSVGRDNSCGPALKMLGLGITQPGRGSPFVRGVRVAGRPGEWLPPYCVHRSMRPRGPHTVYRSKASSRW